jgi:hypothetical protein
MSSSGSGALSAQERLAIRISNIVDSPRAQLERRATIHRLDTEPPEVWDQVLEVLTETEGLDMTFSDDGSLVLAWERPVDMDYGREEQKPDEEAPF